MLITSITSSTNFPKKNGAAMSLTICKSEATMVREYQNSEFASKRSDKLTPLSTF